MDDTNEPLTVSALAAKPLVHRGCRVVTLAQVDQLHGRAEGTARRNFTAHRDRLEEGEDFFLVEVETKGGRQTSTLLTESGYLLLTKPMNDELAWRVQKSLVRGYFRLAGQGTALPLDPRITALAERDAALEARIAALEARLSPLPPKKAKTGTSVGRALYLSILTPEDVKALVRVFESWGPRPMAVRELAEARTADLLRELEALAGGVRRIGYLFKRLLGRELAGWTIERVPDRPGRLGIRWIPRPVAPATPVVTSAGTTAADRN